VVFTDLKLLVVQKESSVVVHRLPDYRDKVMCSLDSNLLPAGSIVHIFPMAF